MGTQLNGKPLNPTLRHSSPRGGHGERIGFEELSGDPNNVIDLGDLGDVANTVAPNLGSLVAGDGGQFVEFRAGSDGYMIAYDSTSPSGLVVRELTIEDVDLLLVVAPWFAVELAVTYASGMISTETWTRTGGNRIKAIEYSYTDGSLSQIDTYVYALDGVSVRRHLRATVTYSSGVWVGGSVVRVV